MADERPDGDLGDDEQGEETSDVDEHGEEQSISPLSRSTHVNRAKETGQLVMEGTQLRSAHRTGTQATRQTSEQARKSSGSQAFKISCTVVPDSVGQFKSA